MYVNKYAYTIYSVTNRGLKNSKLVCAVIFTISIIMCTLNTLKKIKIRLLLTFLFFTIKYYLRCTLCNIFDHFW